MSKRRKVEEEDKKTGLKRIKTETSDFSESSDSENSSKRLQDSSSEPGSENELKSKGVLRVTKEDEDISQSCKAEEEPVSISRTMDTDTVEVASPGPGECPGEEGKTFISQNLSLNEVQGCIVEIKSTVKTSPKEHYSGMPRTHTPKSSSDTVDSRVSRETTETVLMPEARCSVLNPSPSDLRKTENDVQHQVGRNSGTKMEFAHSEVIRPVTSVSESAALAEREKVQQQQQYASIMPCINNVSLAEDVRKPHKLSSSPDVAKSKSNPSPDLLKSRRNPSPDAMKSKTHGVLEALRPKPNTSPEVTKHKSRYAQNSQSTHPSIKQEPNPASGFKRVPTRITPSDSCKSPLIVDKNEHFTVYRDPALMRPETDSNHVAYLSSHLHSLRGSTHTTCLTPSPHPHSHLLPASPLSPHPHHQVHHPLLPNMLTAMPGTPLLAGHPRLDSAALGHLQLPHHHPHQQQQFLQQQPPPSLLAQTHAGASYNQLGLYPIIWQYPNGTHSYPAGLGLPVSSDASLPRVRARLM